MVTKITSPVTPLEVIDKINEIVDDKQDVLVSGTNIKTINNTSILGSGNIDIQGGGSYTAGDGIDITNNVISVDGVTTSEVTLATVATTGAYSDLTGTPSLATVATSGSYTDLSNKPTIPTVNNATLTITQGGMSKGTFTANASSDVTIALDSGGGASRNIGQIVQSTIPLTDAGLHLLDGSLISSGSYADFVTYIAGLVSNYPDLFTTEANWQSAVATYGVCGKFVYDSVNNTVRLPKVTGFTEGTTDVTALGDLIEAGLPNITGTSNGYCTAGAEPGTDVSGCIYNIPYNVNQGAATNPAWNSKFGIDASRSSSIYGNSTTVQPQSIKVLYYIVVATSTKTQIEVDIDEVMTDLNGKADIDLGNCTAPHIVETYVNGTSWYRVYSDGWIEQGGQFGGDGAGDITIGLLKTMADTNYSLEVFANVSDGTFFGTGYKNSTSQITIWTTNYLGGMTRQAGSNWKVCGYGA